MYLSFIRQSKIYHLYIQDILIRRSEKILNTLFPGIPHTIPRIVPQRHSDRPLRVPISYSKHLLAMVPEVEITLTECGGEQHLESVNRATVISYTHLRAHETDSYLV